MYILRLNFKNNFSLLLNSIYNQTILTILPNFKWSLIIRLGVITQNTLEFSFFLGFGP